MGMENSRRISDGVFAGRSTGGPPDAHESVGGVWRGLAGVLSVGPGRWVGCGRRPQRARPPGFWGAVVRACSVEHQVVSGGALQGGARRRTCAPTCVHARAVLGMHVRWSAGPERSPGEREGQPPTFKGVPTPFRKQSGRVILRLAKTCHCSAPPDEQPVGAVRPSDVVAVVVDVEAAEEGA